MNNYDKLIQVISDEKIELASNFKEFLHTKLTLGQTRYVCRYGTLSDGHEKITEAQRYFSAIKEMYGLSNNIKTQKIIAKRAQADLLDAQEKLKESYKLSDKLRAEADCEQAESMLLNALVIVEDQMRQLDEYNKVRLELQDSVEAKYPLGIEQAEEDNWKAVYEYRMIKSIQQGAPHELTSNVPLSPELKAQLGFKYNRPDSVAPLAISSGKPFEQLKIDVESKLKLIQNKKEG